MAREYVTIPKEMYLWAIERAGYDVGEFLKTHPDIAMYVEDEKKPTIKQLGLHLRSMCLWHIYYSHLHQLKHLPSLCSEGKREVENSI